MNKLRLLTITIIAITCFSANNANANDFLPTLNDKASYSSTKSLNSSDSNLVIHSFNKESGIVEAINYELNINKKEYGSGLSSKNYNINILDGYEYKITVKYDSSNLANSIYVKQKNYANTNYSGDFVSLNKPVYWSAYALSSGISNLMGKMGNITGNFIDIDTTTTTKQAWGGAILARGEMGDINANFIGNHSESTITEAVGGAIAGAQYTTKSIVGDFIGNYTKGEKTSGGFGGAVYIVNNAVINSIKGNFIANSAQSDTVSAYGGAVDIYRNGKIGSIEGDFIANYAKGYNEAYGGAIEIIGTIDSIKGDFIENYANSNVNNAIAGAIHIGNTSIGTINGNFINNYANGNKDGIGGAIYSAGTIEKIKGNFIGNSAISQTGDAYGGAIYSTGTIKQLIGDYVANNSIAKTGNSYGGAIFADNSTLNEITGSFYGNYAKAENGEAFGGAIWTNNDINFVADNKTIEFAENYIENNGTKEDNAIYVANSDATLNFQLKNGGILSIKDNFDGLEGYNVNIIGENLNNVFLYNDMKNADLTLNSINLNTIDKTTHTYELNSLTLENETSFAPEVDFTKNEMDRFTTNNGYSIADGAKLHISNLHFLNEQKQDKVSILFAEKGLKDFVEYKGIRKIVTPIYIYDINYKNNNDAGYFVFTRGFGSSGTSGFNPAVLSSQTSASVGAMGTMNQTMSYSFTNSDILMNIPYIERVAIKNQNKYAYVNDGSLGRFSPLYLQGNEKQSIWIKPYSIFENVPLKNGPKVSNISYGTLIGFDSELQELRRGWDRVFTGYVGYNGASQRYCGIDSTQNGGIFGGTMTLYKKHFFNATTLSIGANVLNSQSLYGSDSATTLLSGIGNKSGYNFEFKDGKIIVQPSMLIAYTMIKTFDYTNSAGISINSNPQHTIQLIPSIKIIGNLKNGWQPYISASMVWNKLISSETTANNVELPEAKIKPYVQYGVGVQKRIKENFTTYAQAMVQNGGRNGVSLSAGFRWAIGKDNKK